MASTMNVGTLTYMSPEVADDDGGNSKYDPFASDGKIRYFKNETNNHFIIFSIFIRNTYY